MTPRSVNCGDGSARRRLSNKMTAMIRDGRIREMCETYCADSMKQTMTPADLAEMYAQVVSRAGRATSFKPNQWSFRAKKSITESYLASAKIVTHERDTLYYTFVFPNEHARKFVGLHFNSRKPTEGSASPSPLQGSTQSR